MTTPTMEEFGFKDTKLGDFQSPTPAAISSILARIQRELRGALKSFDLDRVRQSVEELGRLRLALDEWEAEQ